MTEKTPTPSRKVLVTGGRSGIGRTIASAFLKAGDTVIICGQNAETLEAEVSEYDRFFGFPADVGQADDVAALFDYIATSHGHLDVLVNNAGISGPTAPIDEITNEEWDRTVAVNLNGPFYCARAAARLMKPRGSGVILNISTTSAKFGLPNRTPYIATKMGVHGLTRTLTRELGPFGIRCNTILPGMVENERGMRVRKARAEASGETIDDLLARRLSVISMRSMVSEQEVADMAVFLASDASLHVTGQEISVCGNIEWE